MSRSLRANRRFQLAVPHADDKTAFTGGVYGKTNGSSEYGANLYA